MLTITDDNNLTDAAITLVYDAIRDSDLYLTLDNAAWDALAAEWGKQVVELINKRLSEHGVGQ